MYAQQTSIDISHSGVGRDLPSPASSPHVRAGLHALLVEPQALDGVVQVELLEDHVVDILTVLCALVVQTVAVRPTRQRSHDHDHISGDTKTPPALIPVKPGLSIDLVLTPGPVHSCSVNVNGVRQQWQLRRWVSIHITVAVAASYAHTSTPQKYFPHFTALFRMGYTV